MQTASNSIIKIKIDDCDIFMDEMGNGQGKITISGHNGHNYSYWWGAMGGTLREFLCRINKEYFASNLIGQRKDNVIDVPGTFAAIRKYIREDLDLPWYKHQEFQKEMRAELKRFEFFCQHEESERYFVDNFFSSFINHLPFHLINDRHDMKTVQNAFKDGFSEHWGFICQRPSNNYLWLEVMHGKLKAELLKPEYATWDPENKGLGISLINKNLTALANDLPCA